jgi:hypothetical protein
VGQATPKREEEAGDTVLRMAGAIVFGAVMVLGIPIAVMLGGAVWSALFGYLASEDAAERGGCD